MLWSLLQLFCSSVSIYHTNTHSFCTPIMQVNPTDVSLMTRYLRMKGTIVERSVRHLASRRRATFPSS